MKSCRGAAAACLIAVPGPLGAVIAPAALQAQEFEEVAARPVADVLPADMISGPYHSVHHTVPMAGFMNVFTVVTDFGTFAVYGDAVLRKLLHELPAIAGLREKDSVVAGLEAGVDGEDMDEGAEQKSGSRQQHHGNGNLAGHERRAQPRPSLGGCATRAGAQAQPRRKHRGEEACRNARPEGDERGCHEYSTVDRHCTNSRE